MNHQEYGQRASVQPPSNRAAPYIRIAFRTNTGRSMVAGGWHCAIFPAFQRVRKGPGYREFPKHHPAHRGCG
ncbi:ORF R U6 [Macacine gammaherpesvirus 5]|nr:ORF R U6 [Macacine gammaherpesvirus 5]